MLNERGRAGGSSSLVEQEKGEAFILTSDFTAIHITLYEKVDFDKGLTRAQFKSLRAPDRSYTGHRPRKR